MFYNKFYDFTLFNAGKKKNILLESYAYWTVHHLDI